MPPQQIAHQWFIPGTGIDRHVISADIQRYLGNDATVRPGMGSSGDNKGVDGYWIKAYRNLTSAMIADLRADTVRWRQEQRQPGSKDNYVGSSTYKESSAAKNQPRRGNESPSMMDPPYGAGNSRDRMPGRPVEGIGRSNDAMQIDPPALSHPQRGFNNQPSRGGYVDDSRYASQPDPRSQRMPDRDFRDQTMSDPYSNAPVTSSYPQDQPRFGSSSSNYPPTNDGLPSGYQRAGNFRGAMSSAKEPSPIMSTSRPDMPYGTTPSPFAQQQQPPPQMQGRDPRDHRNDHRDIKSQRDSRDTRFGGGSDFQQDARYAYPSPATTTVSLNSRQRENVTSPPQPSPYSAMSTQQDQFGRPVQTPAPYSAPDPSPYGSHVPREQTFGRDTGRERRVAPSNDLPDARRRRH